MNPSSIIGLIALSLVLLLSLWLILRSFRRKVYTVESTEEVDGERTLLANAVLTVLQFALQELRPDEPVSATSPDGNRSYLRIVTPAGHIIIQFDWLHKKVLLFHGCHTDTESMMAFETLKIRNNLVDEIKLSKFGHDAAAQELEIVERKILHSEGFKHLVLNTLAQAAEGSEEEMEKENGGQ